MRRFAGVESVALPAGLALICVAPRFPPVAPPITERPWQVSVTRPALRAVSYTLPAWGTGATFVLSPRQACLRSRSGG